jgi:hypothetical protein
VLAGEFLGADEDGVTAMRVTSVRIDDVEHAFRHPFTALFGADTTEAADRPRGWADAWPSD